MIQASTIKGHGLALDFEGNLKNGIREIGVVYFLNFKIIDTRELVVNKSIDLIGILEDISKYQFIISHNVMIEKNLITKLFPYPKCHTNNLKQWGPWLDTVKIYQKLYPNLSTYDLKFLVAQFLDKNVIDILSSNYCKEDKRKYHNALFDALCSFMLVKRLCDLIDLQNFLQN